MASSDVPTVIADLAGWLTSEARLIEDSGVLDQVIVDKLRAAGLPLARYTTGVPSLHPQVDSFSTLWEQGKGLTFRQFKLDPDAVSRVSDSPIFAAYREGRSTRWRLTGPAAEDEPEILRDLREAGLTDYVILALPLSDGSNKAMTFATDAAEGFSDDQVAILMGLRHAFASVMEVRYLWHLAGTLMDTYVGPVAGRKVLDGAIRRGSGDIIRAAIWFCDLKGFTALTETLPGAQLLETLDRYFDVMTEAIEAEGGEVLKFIGDAVLAIFQPGEEGDTAAAERALRAAQQAVATLETVNRERRQDDKPAIDCGIALHVGEVLYGNVGGRKRLDFTVIGPAVNLASRIESLTRELARPVLVSQAFADLHGGAFDALGAFALKGIAEEARVYAPSQCT